MRAIKFVDLVMELPLPGVFLHEKAKSPVSIGVFSMMLSKILMKSSHIGNNFLILYSVSVAIVFNDFSASNCWNSTIFHIFDQLNSFKLALDK